MDELTPKTQALAEAVLERMRAMDSFSAWLGLEVAEIAPGRAVVRVRIRADMLNAFGTCHGGVTFALVDAALGFAGNTHGRVAVSMEGNISFTRPIREHDQLTLTAQEQSRGNRIAVYAVTAQNQHGECVASARGTLYALDHEHFSEGQLATP